MKAWWAKTKEGWNALAVREKRMLSIGASCLAIFIFYMGAWKPYCDHIALMRSQIIRGEKTLSFMQAADRDLQALEKGSIGNDPALSKVALLSQIQRQIRAANLGQSLTQLQQTSQENVHIQLQKIEFDKLMALLIGLNRAYALSVTQMSVSLNAAPGVVNADIQLGHDAKPTS
jgi:general secretion pathway protein M